MNSMITQVRDFESLFLQACCAAHVITVIPINQLHFLPNESAELAGRSKFNCIELFFIAILNGPTLYYMWCTY